MHCLRHCRVLLPLALMCSFLLSCGGGGSSPQQPSPVLQSQMVTLSVTVTGAGTVTSSPPGINCPSACSTSFSQATTVTLTATAASGQNFTGFSKGCSGLMCKLTLSANTQVDALFAQVTPPAAQAQVTVSITGTGTITSSPDGINCPSTCTASFTAGTTVALMATPGSGAQFSGFGGACSGATCSLTLTSTSANVSAVFSTMAVNLTVIPVGDGGGTVTTVPTGINCPGTCSYKFPYGTSVHLNAMANSGSKLSGWFGAGCSGTTCDLALSSDQAVTAAFLKIPPQPKTVQVLTERYDNNRDGLNAQENVLYPGNVSTYLFGKIAHYALDGDAFAQPLFVDGLVIGGHIMNVVYVATENDSVYAFDATGQTSGPLWHDNFTDPANGISTLGGTPVGGITSTPVIDLTSSTLYVVASTSENGVWTQRLHALDLATGADKFGGPVEVNANVNGVVLDPTLELNRSALLLTGGELYIAEGALELTAAEKTTFHGLVMQYDPTTLAQQWAWASTPDGQEGGVWMSGTGLAADGNGYVYAATGNGTFNVDTGGSSYGNSVVKFSATGTVADYFTPYNQLVLGNNDWDMAAGGVLLIPGSSLATICDKRGGIYLLNTGGLGGYNTASNGQIPQYLPFAVGNPDSSGERNWSTAAFWNGNVYYGGLWDTIRQFSFSGSLLSTGPVHASTHVFSGSRGVEPTVSANGTTGGIVWAAETDGVLYALDATNVSKELYNSAQNSARDGYNSGIKFQLPTVAEGRVYVAGQGELAIFGLLNP